MLSGAPMPSPPLATPQIVPAWILAPELEVVPNLPPPRPLCRSDENRRAGLDVSAEQFRSHGLYLGSYGARARAHKYTRPKVSPS